jgi:hypothetical protein
MIQYERDNVAEMQRGQGQNGPLVNPLTMQSVRDPANVLDLMIVPDMSGAQRDGSRLIRRLLMTRCTTCSQKNLARRRQPDLGVGEGDWQV